MNGSTIETRYQYLKRTTEMLPIGRETANRQIERMEELGIPYSLGRIGISWNEAVDERIRKIEKATGLRSPGRRGERREQPKEVKRLNNWLKDTSLEKRRRGWEFKIGEAMTTLSVEREWLPAFVTLTVDPKAYDARKIIEQNKAFRRFQIDLAEIIRKTIGVKRRTRGGPHARTYIQHAATVEHGKTRKHHHIHAIFWMRDIPPNWKLDPNRGRKKKNAREILQLKGIWPYGAVSRMQAFRFIGDPWSRVLGWEYPTGIRLQTAEKAGSYLGKYIGKESKEWKHRMKTSRRLGMARLSHLLRQETTWSLRNTWETQEEKTASICRRSNVPEDTVKREARSEIWQRLYGNSESRKTLWTLTITPQTWNCYEAMKKSVKGGAEPWSMDSEQLRVWRLECKRPAEQNASCEALWTKIKNRWESRRSETVTPLAGVSHG